MSGDHATAHLGDQDVTKKLVQVVITKPEIVYSPFRPHLGDVRVAALY